MQLRVRSVVDPTSSMREISLTSSELATFSALPGQDIALAFSTEAGVVRRRYSIRRLDPTGLSLDIDVVMHGDGPGMRWAKQAQPGMLVDAIGPRGKITLATGVDWHLFAGDATAVPAALAMIEALPATVPSLGFFLVDDPAEQQDVPAGRPVEWQYTEDGLRKRLGQAELPKGSGHAYLAGEVTLVTRLKAELLGRGWKAEDISAKAYWNRGRPNQGHGEPEQKAS